MVVETDPAQLAVDIERRGIQWGSGIGHTITGHCTKWLHADALIVYSDGREAGFIKPAPGRRHREPP